MNLSEAGKDEIRKLIEELAKKVPEGQKIKLSKKALEYLIFDGFYEVNGKKFRIPVWTGNFLKKIDLSELDIAENKLLQEYGDFNDEKLDELKVVIERKIAESEDEEQELERRIAELEDETKSVRKYGFHGTSVKDIIQKMEEKLTQKSISNLPIMHYEKNGRISSTWIPSSQEDVSNQEVKQDGKGRK